MNAMLRIALRNLREHRAKTIIVGVLIAMGVLLLVVGNSLLATAAAGMKTVFIENFTGHIMVRAISDTPVAIAGSSGLSLDDFAGPRLPEYREVYRHLESYDETRALNPQVPYIARLDYSRPGLNQGAILPIFGVEPESYLRMFPNTVAILEGRFLEPGEQGLVLHRVIRDQLMDELDIAIHPGDSVKLQSITQAAGTRIRELPVVGIYEFAVEAPAMDGMAIMDIHTVRDLAGMVVGTTAVVAIDAADTSLLDSITDFDDLFADVFSEVDDVTELADYTFSTAVSEVVTAEEPAPGIEALPAGDDEVQVDVRQYSRVDSGAWSYILVMLDESADIDEMILRINRDMQELGIAVEAIEWGAASGGMAAFVQAFQMLFLVIVALITVVSVIIIMNTLVISVIERTPEIGTMRALGARRSTVRRMFVLESMSIAVVFGTLGLLLGLLLLWVLNLIGLSAPNAFFELLFGGETLRPVFSFSGVLQAIVMMLGIGLVSSLYPVAVALKIQPRQAMQSE